VLQHAGLLRLADQIALIPALEAGELVGRRQRRLRLAVALDLGDLVERLPARARLCPLGRQRLSLEGGQREHSSVREVLGTATGQRRLRLSVLTSDQDARQSFSSEGDDNAP
jgi:hypothetical protein